MRKLLFLIAVLTLFVSTAAYSATTWFMSEGSTQGSFELYILVNNPGASESNVKYTFYTDTETITLDSAVSPYDTYCRVGAGKRVTLNVNWLAAQTGFSGLSGKPISTKVESTNGINIIAERAMYWDDSNMLWDSGHTTRGVSGIEGCFAEIGQPSSFPITISTSGSYKLIGNINSTDTDDHIIRITASNVTLDLNGFTLDGPDSTIANGIQVAGLYNIKIRNGTIQDCGTGINLTSVTNFAITDIISYSNVNGFVLTDSQGVVIENCQGSVNENGILLTNSLYNTIRENTFHSNTSDGIGIRGGSTFNRIAENHCVNNGNGSSRFDINDEGSSNLFVYNSVATAAGVATEEAEFADDLGGGVGLNEDLN